jgi:SAM-dependent methyltransferase
LTGGEPSLVPVGRTLAFLDEVLPPAAGRLLEVGCGLGEVAAELVRRGWEVVALDTSPEAVAGARARGVDAREASFPDFEDTGRFDAVLFVRVLHHVESLEATLGKVRELLRPGGMLAIDDYDWEGVDRRTAAWAYGMLGALAAAGLIPCEEWESGGDAHAAWHRSYEAEGLFTGDEMRRELAGRFTIEREEGAPYFYRYACKHLAGDQGVAVAERVLETELELLREGAIRPLGLRFAVRG